MSAVDVYAPPRGRCHFGTQPVAMHHNLLPAGELGNVGEFRDLPRVFDNGVNAACACGVPLHVAMTRLCRLSKSAGICAGRSSCSVLWAVAVVAWCYVLGLTQGAFFIFHLLTKPFPSRDQPPIHLDHMTNHLTSHLTTHMTSHMPFQSPAPQESPCPISPAPESPAHHLTLPHLTSHDPIPTPDSSLFAYLSFASGFSARLLYLLHSLILRLILTPFLLLSRASQFRSI